ncbi:MAG: type II secretion system protein, partial [Verrucomicrobia bacterium]|nr:type II secretion system protein [Verrucomicrobiota bacterium]
ELLVIVFTAVMIVGLLIPGLVRERRRAGVVNCSNNLKQVGLAFRTWPIDSTADNPMHIPAARGGTKELVGTGQVFVHFRVMSNELSSPKVLVCPLDKTKIVAANFAVGFSDKNVSYFVGTDADETNPQMFISGDRNLAFQGQPIRPGLFVLTTNTTSVAWAKGLHHPCGNVGLADGSVQFLDLKRLTAGVQGQGMATNLLVVP